MEILLAACLLAYAAGAQSEQARLGISPAQRDLMREKVRHEKAVRRIAEKHGTVPDKEAAQPLSLPEAFQSGYRGQTPVARIATPLGRHAGLLAAKGVQWAAATGKSAVREFRKRRKAAGQPDPAPVLIPMPPSQPPTVGQPQPAPAATPAVQTSPGGLPETQPTAPATVPAQKPQVDLDWLYGAPDPALQSPAQPAPDTAHTTPDNTRTPEGGTGRMAAEVSYESVMEESDELSLMCDDDMRVYDRIRHRCEREIGRADDLIAQLQTVGAGDRVTSWVVRCREQYQVIQDQIDELERNTLAQGEAVTKAKALLEAGQGVYAQIAAGMESVAERDFYTSDSADSEDTNADTETYETRGAAA